MKISMTVFAKKYCTKHIFGLIWGQTFCSLLATLNMSDYSCRLLYLSPRGDICCTGRHTLATRSSTFGNMFYFCFVSWQDIIGQVRLLYNGPLYAAVCSGAGYQFLGGFALVWESSKSATLVLSQTPPSDVWVRYSVPLGFTQIKLTKILNTSKNQHIWHFTGPDLCHKTQAYVNIKAEMPLCHLPKTHFSGVLL